MEFFFWLGCLCWFIGICAYAVYAYRQTVIFTVFAILFLTMYWRVNMFSKIKELHKTYRKNQKKTIVVDIHSYHNDVADNNLTIASFLNKNSELEDDSFFHDGLSKNTTFIASNMTINGNVVADGIVYILGRVNGNITVIDGTIKIIKNGVVNGNMVARYLISDGHSEGKVIASDIVVLENGHIKGCVIYDSLSIRSGGVIDGKTSLRKKK